MVRDQALESQLGELGLTRSLEGLDAGVAVQNRIVVISGFRGSGKTTLAARILRQRPKVVIYDPNEDPAYSWVPNTVYSIDGDENSLVEYFRWVNREKKPTFCVRYVPEDYEGDGGLYTDADEFCELIFRGRRLCVCFEEVHQVAQTPAPSSMPPQLRKLINRGRHREIDILCTGIRYSEIPRPITAGANLHIVFHTAEPGDRQELVRRIGTEATDAVANLGEHEAVVFDTFTRKFLTMNSRDAIRISELG